MSDDIIEQAIERAKSDSKQPRFSVTDPNQFFIDVMGWVSQAEQEKAEPPYVSNSRARDKWLAEFWHTEPHLAGVLHSMTSIDANRGWSLIGGRNQVYRFTDVLHNWKVAPGLSGWRHGMQAAALSFYTADLGAPVEVGRDGKAGPVRGFYHVDPANCRMTSDINYPLSYRPGGGKEQAWAEADFIRMVSMVNTQEKFNGLGYCFESRVLVLAKIMVAVYRHDLEELGAQAPRGLLLLMGINEGQWDNAMAGRKAKLEEKNLQYYNAVAVLASSGMQTLDAKLIALSNLPANFDIQKWTSLMMYGYALCAGYDPSEFYPVQFGSLGRGTEMEVQHQKATGKGGLNFVLNVQEQLQRPDVLPDTIQFEFDQRDDQGELLQSQVSKSWIDTFRAAREAGGTIDAMGGITREEFRMLLAEKDIIPREWTEAQDEVEATDVEDAEAGNTEPDVEATDAEDAERLGKRRQSIQVERFLDMPRVRRAIDRFQGEPIVWYSYPANRMKIIYDHERASHVYLVAKKRQAADEVLYDSGGVVITGADVTRAITDGGKRVGDEFKQLLDNVPIEEQ